eukprot:gb/GECG01010912.1/.p1 GENE.gb/GECG01010912.1/~~gb/GECG01010912.1/.p1  ORF type:complete len:245 (+),score=50.81 gb/GECG01010912.1/:1-735(+)
MAHSGQDIDIEQGNTEHSADTKGANRRSPSHRNIDKNLAQPLMSSSGSDPFYAFRDALKDAVNKLELSREKWRNLLENTNTAESTAFQTTHSELLNSVKQVEQDIRNIKKTVKHVERNRNQFPHIDDAELSSRKEFISQTEKTVQEIKDEINSRKTKGKMHSDERKILQSKPGSSGAGEENMNKYQKANQDFVQESKQQQQQLIQQQDQHLDQMDRTLTTIDQMAKNINSELEEQGRCLFLTSE